MELNLNTQGHIIAKVFIKLNLAEVALSSNYIRTINIIRFGLFNLQIQQHM